MVEDGLKKDCKAIVQCLRDGLLCNPPVPFMTAGTIMKKLKMPKSNFYLAVSQLMGGQVGEVTEGKKRCYYLMAMVHAFRDGQVR